MKQFQISTPTEMRVVNVNPRAEKHGKNNVPAVDIRLRLTAANTILDQLNPDLRQALYVALGQREEPPQGELDGVAPPTDTPTLRVDGLQPVKLSDELTGYTVTFDLGTGRKESILTLDSCKLNSFEIEAMQGGSVAISCRVQASGIDKRTFGELCVLIDCDASVSLEPPEVVETPQGEVVATVDFRAGSRTTH